MGRHCFIRASVLALLLVLSGYTQDIPLQEPHLLPFPSISSGISYFSLIPTQNLQLNSNPSGWTIEDTLTGLGATLDIELLRYRWYDHFFGPAKFEVYSSLGYSFFFQTSNEPLPANYPSAFEINKSVISRFSMNALIREYYLNHHFTYKYSRRGSLHANLTTGITHLSLYKNGDGIRFLESNGLGLHLGLGWKTTLLGRVGKRIRVGVDLGYSLRSFDLTQQDENFKLADGSSAPISPIQTIAFNTPDLQINVEFGEFLFSAFTPYRDPFKLGLLNFSMGIGLINPQAGISLQFDSTGTSLSIPFWAKTAQNYDLQIFKYNWPFHLLAQANIDILSGIGIRYWKNSQQTRLPSGWARQLTDGSAVFSGMRFSPKILDFYLEHEIIYPLGPKLHAKLSAGNGFATMTLYENGLSERLIDANALTWQLGAGLGYTIKGDGSSKIDFGLSFGYHHQAFEIDMSSSNLTAVNPMERIPITYVDLSQPIISFDIGLIFGGSSNAALKAHNAFRQKQYSDALTLQQDLLNLFPDHHNKKMILIQKQAIEDSLVTRYYRDVANILSKGRLGNAHALINQGETPPNLAVRSAVDKMKIELSDQALTKAGAALEILDYEQAEDFILLSLKSDPASAPIAKVLLARSYIIRATILYQSGVYGRSQYWLRQAEGLTDRYKLVIVDLRKKIADGRLDDANEGIQKEDRLMVYEAMKEAKALNPILEDIVNEHLGDLRRAIEHADEQRLAPLKRMALDNLLDDVSGLNPENFKPRIGMKGSLIERYVGAPQRKFDEGDYELWVYPESDELELWLYLRDGVIEKVEHQK